MSRAPHGRLLALLLAAAFLLNGCVTKSRIPDSVELVRADERQLATLENYRFHVTREGDQLLVDLSQEISVEKFSLYRIQELERRRWPRPAGVWYFMMDVFLLKYLTPLGFGVYLVEQHFEHAKGLFLVLLPLTAFTYPVLVFAGGTVAGVFLYSPLTILYTPFGASHRGMVTDFYDSKSEGFREDIGYLPRIGDTALSWLPFYPGFTDKFGERDRVLREYEEERDKQRETRFEPLRQLAPGDNLSIEIAGAGNHPLASANGRVTIPSGALDYFTADDTIQFALRRGGDVLATTTIPAAELGVTGTVPRAFRDELPALAVEASLLDELRDATWGAGEALYLLVEVRNTGNIPAYNIAYQLNTGAAPTSREVRVAWPPGSVTAPMRPDADAPIPLAERLAPGQAIRVVERLTFGEDMDSLTFILLDGPGREHTRLQRRADGGAVFHP